MPSQTTTKECTNRNRKTGTHDERIYAAAAEYAETLSFSRLRDFLAEATHWRSLLMLRH